MLTQDPQHFNLAVNAHPDRRTPAMIDVGTARQLLCDDLFIAPGRGYEQYPYGIRWVTVPARKHDAPLLEADPQFEASIAWVSLLKEGGIYRLWYNAGHTGRRGLVVSYAESADGLTFHRRHLGVVDGPEQAQNNIVFTGGLNGVAQELGNVFVDPHAPAAERYKLVYSEWEGPHVFDLPFTHNVGMLRGAASPDGIHWRRYYENFYGRYCDSQNVACWDETLGRFVLYHRSFSFYGGVQANATAIPAARRGRAIGRMESSDFRQWSNSEIALAPDFADGLNVDIYNSAYARYPGAQNCHFLFPSFYQHYEGTFQVQVCFSRDNQRWLRPARTTFIPLGEPGRFDSFIISAAPGFVQVDSDHYALYYRSGDMPHGGAHITLTDEERQRTQSRMSRVTFKRDRIIGIEAQDEVGQFSTRPVRAAGNQLLLNIEPLGPDAWLKAQLLSAETDQPIPGYTFDDCLPLTTDDLDAGVHWRGADTIGAAILQAPVRLHLRFQQMRVYAFQFTTSDGNVRPL
jgi:hypothetical protein